MIEEDLGILIAAYEDDKKELEEIIRQYLSEDDLEFAYYHHKALMIIKKNINTLKRIENPFYFLTELHQKAVKKWEDKLKEAEPIGLPTEFILLNIEHHKREIEKLETELMNSKQIQADNIIEQALSELFANKIKYFKVHLTRKEVFYFKFTFTRKSLNITIPFIKALLTNYIRQQNVKGLINMGFVLSKSGNRLKITLTGDRDQILAKFKILFSRIIFDVLYITEFRNQGAIELGPLV